MNISESKSEVARLMQQITLEHEAAQRGLTGTAYGTAQHTFINERLENMGRYHETLKQIVGEQEAIKILVAVWEQ